MIPAHITRRSAITTFGASPFFLHAQTAIQPLLAGPEDFASAHKRAARNPWAKAILSGLLQAADTQLAQPVSVPDRAGQWGHWYVCRKDGVSLVTDSTTRHRCPLCGAVYTGEPYDSVYIARIHSANSSAMRALGLAFAFTNRRDYALRAGDLLTAYADRYLSYPRHDINGKDSVNAGRLMSQTLDESTWLIPVVWAYTLVRDTLPSVRRAHIEGALLRPAAETIIGPSYDQLPNIQCWKNSAVGCVGYALEDQTLISTALDNPIRGFRILMSRRVVEGGLWSEGSLGYQRYALEAMWPLAEAARRHGDNLYANENYRALFDGPIGLALPNGDPPGFSDNPGTNLALWNTVYELAYARWKDPQYGRVLRLGQRNALTALLYGVENLPDGDCVPKTSILYNKAGFAALRSPSVTVAVRFGLHGSGHGHPDMLNIVTFADGKLFGIDPGSIGYGAPLHHEWYRSTIAHNTVSVDEQLQSNADGHGVSWSQDGARTVWKGAASVYPGVDFERELILEGSKITDRFSCKSDSEHTYDWAFHSEGTLTTSVATTSQPALGSTNGYQHIKDVQRGDVDKNFTATWVQGDTTLTVNVKGEPGTIVVTGAAPGRNPANPTPLLIIRRKTKNTVFEIEHVFTASS